MAESLGMRLFLKPLNAAEQCEKKNPLKKYSRSDVLTLHV
jgi:hypothetical protein